MSNKYTYQDVIIDPNDPRVEIGAEYYFSNFPADCLGLANSEETDPFAFGTLKKIDKDLVSPFSLKGGKFFCCMIRKKVSEGKYIPFDLSKPEVRKKLRGAWIGIKDYPLIEYQITSLNKAYVFCLAQKEGIGPDQLLMFYQFVDGSPCGELEEI